MILLPRLCEILGGWQPCFADHRTFRRAKEHALALLVCLGRRTISRTICVLGRQFRSWTSEYRLFSRCRWQPQALFDAVLQRLPELLHPAQPLVAALDDTPCPKTGKRIRAAKILRDPLSPPFHLNFCHALRFLQATILIGPPGSTAAARAIPVAFDLAPPVAKPKPPRKPRRGASRQDWAAYARACRLHRQMMKSFRKRQQEEGLSAQGAKLLNALRQRCQSLAAWKDRTLWAVVDASFCNRTVFGLLDHRIVLIGRVRSDLRLYQPASPPPHPPAVKVKGRKSSYGPLLPTPEALRQDTSQPWQQCSVFAAGKRHALHYKTLAPVLWRSGAGTRPLRLIVLRPLRYRAHGHTLYRRPAYLLLSDPAVPVAPALQAYFYRWEIEADQKEEKDLLGVGQAQVWSDTAVVRQPAFHVATYAALLVAAVKAYGLNNPTPAGHLPLWRQRKPPVRLSAAHLLAKLRQEIQEYEAIPSPPRGQKRSAKFPADALRGHFGKKFPITAEAIMNNAWT
jgi:DDE superfamily endonuclease